MSKTVAFIPARAGSKGVPGKNKKPFLGRALFLWSIEQAQRAGIFDKIIVSTDDPDIMEPCQDDDIFKMELNLEVVERNPRLCEDGTSLDDVLYDYFSRPKNKCDYICLLQPTSPLRVAEDIQDSFKFVKYKKYESVVGVTWNPIMGWVEGAMKAGPVVLYLVNKRPNRQSRDNWFLENGAIYWMKWQMLMTYRNRIGNPGNVKLYKMPPERSLEVDTPLDWYITEQVYAYNCK